MLFYLILLCNKKELKYFKIIKKKDINLCNIEKQEFS